MIELVSNQQECSDAFRHWADAMLSSSTSKDYGWVIEGKGIVFTNYGDGDHGEIATQVMLGADPKFRNGVVKIVQPKATRLDKGPTTVIGRRENGSLSLLREGRLQKNNLSRFIKDDFSKLSGLNEVPLYVEEARSERHWYVVADLAAGSAAIAAQTASFANACARARSRAGGGTPSKVEVQAHDTFGMDEKGRVMMVTRTGGTAEVEALQGYVYEELKKLVGKELRKPSRNGYCVDGMIDPANLLLEIKTSASSHSIYEAVGQLRLYPRLIGIAAAPAVALLIPDLPPLNPIMASALEAEDIAVFTYRIIRTAKKPKIEFPKSLIKRCRERLR